MKKIEERHIKELIDRLSRINAADEWTEDLNPTQWTALSYLARANRFSRSPSQVSDFMATTRGTVSQTLKALAKKGLISEIGSDLDKRSISYSVTPSGEALVEQNSTLKRAISLLSADETSSLQTGLSNLVHNALIERGLRAFGVCETCVHHQKANPGGYCKLLDVSLTDPETKQICYEHAQVA